MDHYLITYRHKRGRQTYLVELPSIPKPLSWIERNAARCDTVLIQRTEET